jgi:hypothetical protein
MDDRVLSMLAALGLCIVSGAVYLLYRHATHDKRLQAEARYQEHLDAMVRAGVRTAEGSAACIVCGLTAIEYMPVSGASWMDRLPLLNRLFSLPPRYVIDDNVDGDLCLCRLHKAVAVRKLEEFHAGLRAERARFNSMHEERVAAMDGGQMLRCVVEQHSSHLKMLSRNRSTQTPLPQLQRFAEPEEVFETAIVSGAGASIPPDDEPSSEDRP